MSKRTILECWRMSYSDVVGFEFLLPLENGRDDKRHHES